jgi:isopentenyl-diphosphate delta-isomerase
MEDVKQDIRLLGKDLKAPLIISSMTGGSSKAKRYNEMLAKAAVEFGIGMGIGSQRACLERDQHRDSYEVVKDYDVPLMLANVGAPQMSNLLSDGSPNRYRYDSGMIRKAVDMVEADGVCIHLNYLQEVVQPEGETRVDGVLDNISDLSSDFTLIAKETGAGISRNTALELKEAGVSAIDVGGLSGTSFAAVESFRDGRSASRIGKTFWDWGIPTPVSVMECDVGLPLIATGGLRNGLDIARSLSLGATAGGMAWTLLKAASGGYDQLRETISNIVYELRAAVFLSGERSCTDMGLQNCVITGDTSEYARVIRGMRKNPGD